MHDNFACAGGGADLAFSTFLKRGAWLLSRNQGLVVVHPYSTGLNPRLHPQSSSLLGVAHLLRLRVERGRRLVLSRPKRNRTRASNRKRSRILVRRWPQGRRDGSRRRADPARRELTGKKRARLPRSVTEGRLGPLQGWRIFFSTRTSQILAADVSFHNALFGKSTMGGAVANLVAVDVAVVVTPPRF